MAATNFAERASETIYYYHRHVTTDALVVFFPMIFFGQVFGLCYSKYDNDWTYCFLYWKNTASKFVCSQIAGLRKRFYSAGFIHKWHGSHWNRHSKLVRY